MTGPHKPFDNKAFTERLDVNFALQAAGLGVWGIDPLTHKILWDERCWALVGIDRDKPMPFEEAIQYIHSDDLSRVLAAIQLAIMPQSGGYFDETYRTLGADEGKLRWVRFWGQGYFTPAGELHRFSGVAQDVSQQVLDRQKLEESETKLRGLLAAAPAGIGLFVGRELVIENPNQTFIDIVGKGPKIVGLPLREVMPELLTEGQPFLNVLDEVYTTGVPFISPASLVRIVQNGVLNDNYYNISYTPIYDADGQVYAILDIAIDVTTQVKAQQALAESEAHLQLLRDTVPAMIFYLDKDQRYQSHNEAFRNWFGTDGDEAIGKTVREFLGEEAYQSAQPYLDEAYSGQQTRYELHAPARMAGERWLSIVYTPHKTGEENVMGVIVHATDITQIKQVELALRQSETSYRTLSEDLEHQVQVRTEELAASNEELEAANEELAASNEEYATLNEELEEANQLLIRSNDNLQQFAYVASHDLQEPLRKIQQFGDLLKTRHTSLSGEELLYIDRMQAAASRMSTLIRDLLNFSRLSTQRETTTLVALNEVVQEVLTTLELVIAQTGAQLHINLLPTIQGDATQLTQLFQNLLSNALKFRQERVAPRIQINAYTLSLQELPAWVKPGRAARSYYQIDVVDNGVGFDEKYLDRIFQVFQRLHGKSEFAGTGIGLAICERVVANHGGALTARSQVGQGATFSVYFPG